MTSSIELAKGLEPDSDEQGEKGEKGPVLYDSKQKYVTVTGIQHGVGDYEPGKVEMIPPGKDFAKYASKFTDDELDAFVAQGTIEPMAEVNQDISDENDELKEQNVALKDENTSLEARVKELEELLKKASEGKGSNPGTGQQNPPK